jgi:hypothetical protein
MSNNEVLFPTLYDLCTPKPDPDSCSREQKLMSEFVVACCTGKANLSSPGGYDRNITYNTTSPKTRVKWTPFEDLKLQKLYK